MAVQSFGRTVSGTIRMALAAAAIAGGLTGPALAQDKSVESDPNTKTVRGQVSICCGVLLAGSFTFATPRAKLPRIVTRLSAVSGHPLSARGTTTMTPLRRTL